MNYIIQLVRKEIITCPILIGENYYIEKVLLEMNLPAPTNDA